MSQLDASSGPVSTPSRIGMMDVLRGVAVLGILLMNIPVMGMIGEWYRPSLPAVMNTDWVAFLVQEIGFQGTMRGLFTLLFGAGMVLMLGKGSDDTARQQAYLVRCFALMLLGIANFAIFLWPGEILMAYGLSGLLLFLFRKASLRLLWAASLACLILMTVHGVGSRIDKIESIRDIPAAVSAEKAGRELSDDQKAALALNANYNQAMHPSAEKLEEERVSRTSAPGVFIWSIKTFAQYSLSPDALWFTLENLGMMLMGMALFRTGVLTGSRSLVFYLGLGLCGYAVGLCLRGIVSWMEWHVQYGLDANTALIKMLLYQPGRVATTLGLLGLVVSLCKAGLLGWLEGGLKAVGRLALTNYVLQSIVTSILFYGFGMLGRFGFAQLMGIAGLIWVGQILLSVLWLRVFSMGPMEWGLRAVTYGSFRLALPRTRPVNLPSAELPLQSA